MAVALDPDIAETPNIDRMPLFLLHHRSFRPVRSRA